MKNCPSNKNNIFTETNNIFVDNLGIILLIALLVGCLFIFPTSAADEPSEGGQYAAPNDLAGTSWLVPAGWTAPSQEFYYLNASFNDTNINAIFLGTRYSNQYYGAPNQLVYRGTDGSIYNLYNSSSFTVSFFDGSDTSNSNLISWLMANGTWTNPPEPEPEPTPTYTIQPNYYQIKPQPDMIPDDVGFYEYGGQFIYEGETYRSLRFSRVSSLLTNVFLYDDDGNQVVIKGLTVSNDGWFSGRNITLVSPITTENEEAYTYFTENLSATEQSPFDLVTYMISGFFKALDNFYIFFDFTLLDFIFVMCGLLGAIWFLKLLAGG